MKNRQIIFIHGSLNEEVQAFKKTVESLVAIHPNLKVHYCYDDFAKPGNVRESNTSVGYINTQLIETLVPNRDADYYFCGPHPFMRQIYHELLDWGIPSVQVHFEFFGLRRELEKCRNYDQHMAVC